PLATPEVTTTYQLIATADNGACADTSMVTVTAIPADIDIVSAVDTAYLCFGQSFDLTAITSTGNADGLIWTPDDGSISDTTGLNIIATPEVTTTYLAALTIGACTVFDSLHVQVDSLPQDLSLTVDPLKETYCQGELVTIVSPIYDPSTFPNIEHQWISIGEETGDSLYNLVLTTQDTFTYQRITTSGACVDTAMVTLNVVSNEAISIVPEAPEICEGEEVQLTVVGEQIGDLTWEPATGLSCSDCGNPTANPATTTGYTVTSDVDGCTVTAGVIVAVNQLPEVELAPDQTLCLADATDVVLNFAGAEAGTTYTWSSPDDPGFSSAEANPLVNPSASATYVISAINECGETAGQVSLIIIQPPVIEAGEDITTCVGTIFDLNGILVSGGGGDENYTWIYDGESEVGADAMFEAGNAGYAVLNYTYGPNGSCGTVMDSLLVNALDIAFTVDIESDPVDLDTVFLGQTFTLEAVVNPPTGFDYSYAWMGAGVPANATDPIVEVTAPSDDPDLYTYTVTVSIPEGCEEVAFISVDVIEPQYRIPNVFSPNNDGTNDEFGLFAGGQVENFSLFVYNRWGQLIFESNDPQDRWDGTRNGENAPSDVYLYRMQFRIGGLDYEETGDLTLVR
ncbi:MAG: gliding motility-associated C-terminal domain-containing protein, partial [Lewinella sp.]|nr:gliding motility-associated C-terminal domain-containing protein [Lewinella sp.]